MSAYLSEVQLAFHTCLGATEEIILHGKKKKKLKIVNFLVSLLPIHLKITT